MKEFMNTSDKNENQTLPCSSSSSASICCFFLSFIHVFIYLDFALLLETYRMKFIGFSHCRAICCIQTLFVSGGYESSAIDCRAVIPLPQHAVTRRKRQIQVR